MFVLGRLNIGQLVFVESQAGDIKVGIVISEVFSTPATKLQRAQSKYCAVLCAHGSSYFLVENLHPIPHI